MLVLLNSKKDDSAINGRQKYERNRSQSFGKIKNGATQRTTMIRQRPKKKNESKTRVWQKWRLSAT